MATAGIAPLIDNLQEVWIQTNVCKQETERGNAYTGLLGLDSLSSDFSISSVYKQAVVVPATGVELVTYRLQGGCSTN